MAVRGNAQTLGVEVEAVIMTNGDTNLIMLILQTPLDLRRVF